MLTLLFQLSHALLILKQRRQPLACYLSVYLSIIPCEIVVVVAHIRHGGQVKREEGSNERERKVGSVSRTHANIARQSQFSNYNLHTIKTSEREKR